jgi:hypothetical protein
MHGSENGEVEIYEDEFGEDEQIEDQFVSNHDQPQSTSAQLP